MVISGLQKLTLLDFPQRVACTVFLGGCNFRCPFCQNGEILNGDFEGYTIEQFLSFLKKRQGILDGVCVSGGEPLLSDEVFSLIEKIKQLGYAVNVDTNGSYYERLNTLIDEKLVDFVAMDIKNSPQKYNLTAGVKVNFENVEKSVNLLMNTNIQYEFRTTVVKEYHTEQDFIEIGKWIKGAQRYFLQKFVDSEFVLEKNLSSYSDEQMQEFKKILIPYIPNTKIRGEY